MTTTSKTISSSYGTGSFTFHTIGKLCFVDIDITLTAAANNVVVATGAVESAFNHSSDITPFGQTGKPAAVLSFSSTGDIRMYQGQSGIRYLGSAAYIKA